MSAANIHILGNQQIGQKPSIDRRSTKRLINRECKQILENPESSPKEKLQAAQILEKMLRLKELGSARRQTKILLKRANSPENGKLDDLLREIVANQDKC